MYRVKAGGPPELPGTLSLVMYHKRRYCIEMGGWGGGGCNNVMWTALDWDLLKPWGCCFVGDVVTLQISLLFTEAGVGGWGGCNNVMWSALDWELLKPWGCSFVEAVVIATAPWEDQWCSRSKQLLHKAFVDVKMKKVWCSFRPWFSSELWHFLVVNKTTKNAWNRNSNGFDVAHMFGHPWKM